MDIHFSSPRPNLVVSDAGFSVEILGMVGMRYMEHDRTMFLDSEVLAVPAISLDIRTIKRWDPPHEGEALDEAEKNRIIENIKLAFQSQDWELRLFPLSLEEINAR